MFTDNWLILSDISHRDLLSKAGLTVVAERKIDTLGKSLYTVQSPYSFRDNAEANIKALRSYRTENRSIDYNHLYTLAGDNATSIQMASPAELLPLPKSNDQIKVGMIDTAIDMAHPSLEISNVTSKNFTKNTKAAFDYHGTAIAATLVSNTPQYQGLLTNAELYAASVFDNNPEYGGIASTEDIILAMDWLVQKGVKIVNMSLAGGPNQVLQQAIKAYCEQGIVIVAAVGNSGPHASVMYPAGYDCVVGVTAINTKDRVYRRAVRGKHVDVAAYGVGVLAPDSATGFAPVTGTSFATPYVSAFLATQSSNINDPDWVLKALQRSTDLGAPGKDPIYGYGKIDLTQ